MLHLCQYEERMTTQADFLGERVTHIEPRRTLPRPIWQPCAARCTRWRLTDTLAVGTIGGMAAAAAIAAALPPSLDRGTRPPG